MEHELTFRIVLEKPTTGVDFGLQKGAGSNYETIQKQRSKGTNLIFEFNTRVKINKDSKPTFLGPFVQGKPQERFVYIDIGTYAGQSDTNWSRRLKIPLFNITSETLKKFLQTSSAVLEAKIPGTGKDGGPTCGTIKPFEGWKLVSL
jgi:hypothetical protein